MKKVIAISGSTRKNSTNHRLLEQFAKHTVGTLAVQIFYAIDKLPHFNPDLDNETPPAEVITFRKLIEEADAVLICTPEYVFSIPGSLKNALEWCVSTTVFTDKPLGIITASASGEKGHDELQMIMKVLCASFITDTLLLIHGVKGKVNADGIIHEQTQDDFNVFIENFTAYIGG